MNDDPFSISADSELSKVFNRIWECLREGVNPGRSPFSIAQVATIGLQGEPKLRNLVIRSASQNRVEIRFYTDLRSAKVAEIGADPRVSVVSTDFDSNLQIRFEGTASIISEGPQKQAAWKDCREHSLILYRNPLPPGTAIHHPDEGHPKMGVSDTSDGFENFCLVVVSIINIDWLDLSAQGHERATFRRESSTWSANWVAP